MYLSEVNFKKSLHIISRVRQLYVLHYAAFMNLIFNDTININ